MTTKLLIPITLDYLDSWAIEQTEILLATLCLLGSAICLQRRRNWGLVVAWIFNMSLILAAITPIPVPSAFTGLFYRVPHHIKAMTAVLAVLLAVVALDALRMWLSPLGTQAGSALRGALRRIGLASVSTTVLRTGAAVAALAVCLPIIPIGGQATTTGIREGYLSVRDDTRSITDKAELDIIHRLPDELPGNAVVIGDPVAGIGYIPILTGMHSMWVFPDQTADDQDGIYLREDFNRIHTNPHACELLQRHGIHYFYIDRGIVFNDDRLNKFRPGLYKVGTSSGFTLVDSGGSASLWRIDICG